MQIQPIANKDDLLIVLTDDKQLHIYNITFDATIYKESIENYLNKQALRSAEIFAADYKNIFALHLNKRDLVLFSLSDSETPLIVDSFMKTIFSVNQILNSNFAILVTQNLSENQTQIQFTTIKMFKDYELSSVCSESDLPASLECVIEDSVVIDVCHLHETNNILILTKSSDHNINLHCLWIEVMGEEIKPTLTKITSKHISPVDDHITNGKINHDSICYIGPGQFSVTAELFIGEKLKFLYCEFTNADQKLNEKLDPKLVIESMDVPPNISENLQNVLNIDFSSPAELDILLQNGNLEQFGANILAKDLDCYKYNLKQIQEGLDKKLNSYLSNIQTDESLQTLNQKLKYLSSIETIYKFIYYRKKLEADRTKNLLRMDNFSKAGIKDIYCIDTKIEEISLIKQCVRYFSLISKHNVMQTFNIKLNSIAKTFALKKRSKSMHYDNCFDNFEKKLIYKRNLFIEIILKESENDIIYPFESSKDLHKFMTLSCSKDTMDFVMIYFFLDIYGIDIFELEIGQEITEIKNYREYLAYWLIDNSYAEYRNSEALDTNSSKCIECINHPDSNNIEYIGSILQSLHELKCDKFSKILGSQFYTFLKDKNHTDSTGYIQDLSFYKENDLTIFVYNLCKFKNYSQAYIVLNDKQSDPSFNTAFIMFAYSLIKNFKLLELLNFSFNEVQINLLSKLFKNEALALECFITPYLDSKDPKKIFSLNQIISNELFFDETNEQKLSYDLLFKLILNFKSKMDLRTKSSQNLRSEFLCAETQTQSNNEFNMNTIREESEESKSESEKDDPFLQNLSHSKFKSNRRNIFFLEETENAFKMIEPSPSSDINKLFNWLEESEKRLNTCVDQTTKIANKAYCIEKDAILSENSKEYENESHEETKQVTIEIERKQLYSTPLARKEQENYGYEPGQDTHEKVDNFLNCESD